jgi:TolB-like protein
MGKVFVSYARADKPIVARLVRALRDIGIEPWWDDDIAPGASWEQTIEQALTQASSAIVCWSPTSVASENVRSEARVARGRQCLVQVFLEKCDPPLFFGERQGIDFSDWNGSEDHPQMGQLAQALRSIGSGFPIAAQPKKSRGKRTWVPKAAIAGGLAAVTAISILGWWWTSAAHSSGPARIAIQPIEALGGSGGSSADGLTDQITAALNDGHVPTITRADSQSLKSGDVDAKLKALGADYSINGTVEVSKDAIHARLHLDDRVRHASLWSYEASGPADDPVTLNRSIGQAVAGVLSCAYRGLGSNGLSDTDLLSRYVRVCDLFVNHDDASDTKSTFELLGDLRQITTKAPSFAPAHSDFAKFGAYLAPLMPPDQAASIRAEAAAHAATALKLDRHAADAWLAREMLLPPTEWAARETLLRKAVSVNPDWPHSNGFLGMFLQETGRMEEAAIYGQRASAADLQIEWRPYGAQMACEAGEASSVLPDLRERFQIAPGDETNKWSFRRCLLMSGQFREAQKLGNAPPPGVNPGTFMNAAVEALISRSARDRQRASAIAAKLPVDNSLLQLLIELSAAIGDLDSAYRFASEFKPGYPMTGRTSFMFTPLSAPMRNDPRIFTLAKQYGLLNFWRKTGRWPDFCQSRMAECRKAGG